MPLAERCSYMSFAKKRFKQQDVWSCMAMKRIWCILLFFNATYQIGNIKIWIIYYQKVFRLSWMAWMASHEAWYFTLHLEKALPKSALEILSRWSRSKPSLHHLVLNSSITKWRSNSRKVQALPKQAPTKSGRKAYR